ncbi:MAG TPA: alpha-L-fucosidase, partial [Verrucomicrobiae bacterium]|nr:alpha-L-fucosidase [Verrucomicrobiae bacterium]
NFSLAITPFKQRDIMKELSQECARQGIKFGIYYSIIDWNTAAGYFLPNPSPPTCDSLPEGSTCPPGADLTFAIFKDKSGYISFMKAQLKELIDNYNPAILWFDGNWIPAIRNRDGEAVKGTGWEDEDAKDLSDYVHSLKPDIIVNSRISGPNVAIGDYMEMGDRQIPGTSPMTYWETPMTINNNWGYNALDDNWKTPQTLIGYLTDIESKGGNLLLNVGPTAQGVIPAPSVSRLEMVGTWLTGPGLIQSHGPLLGTQGNFEAVVRDRRRLCHYFRDNDLAPDYPWSSNPTACFGSRVTSAPALIESNLGSNKDNFEVVVEEDNRLCHYYRENDGVVNRWVGPTTCFGDGKVTSAPALIQSDQGPNGNNFEVVVQEGNRVCHYYRENNGTTNPWHGPTDCFGTNVTSAPALIQSDQGPNGDNFEVVVQEGNRVCHYYRENNGTTNPWHGPTDCFGVNVTSAPALIQRHDPDQTKYGRLEVVVREGVQVCQSERNTDNQWSQEPLACFGRNVTSAPALIQSNFGTADTFELEVVAHEGGQLCHYSLQLGMWSTACHPIGKDSVTPRPSIHQ